MAAAKIVHVYQVGDVVRTTESFGPNQAGSIGIVYESYADHDANAPRVISVLLMNGHDIGSFSGEEQTESLVWLGQIGLTYSYSNPAQLMRDYREGYFDQAFTEARVIAEQPHVGSVLYP